MKLKYLEKCKYINLLIFGAVEMIKYHFPHPEMVKSPFGLFLIILFWLLFCPYSTPGKKVNLRKGNAQPVALVVTQGCAWHHGPPRLTCSFWHPSVLILPRAPVTRACWLTREQIGADTPLSQICTAA